ncbi:MAG: Fic family protein [candidate division WOR-3 bacterium]
MENIPAEREKRIKPVKVRAHAPFAFSWYFNNRQVSEKVLEAMVLNTTFNTLPVLPGWVARLNEELIVRSIFGTAAIEGSPITENEVSDLVAAPGDIVPKNERERIILNLRAAYQFAGVGQGKPVNLEPFLISEKHITKLHEIITRGIDDRRYLPGIYRYEAVEVGDADHGGRYRPPKVPDDIKRLMQEFVEWVNSDEIIKGVAPAVRAFLVHYHLALIHPFKDGNGRVARVLEAEILERAGFWYVPLMMSNYYYQHIDDYYRAFTAAEKNEFDLTPFLIFCLDGLVACLREMHKRISDQIRILALRKYYEELRTERKLTSRQHALLLILLEGENEFKAPELKSRAEFMGWYQNVSDRSAARDIRKLLDMKLIVKADGDKYKLNTKALG